MPIPSFVKNTPIPAGGSSSPNGFTFSGGNTTGNTIIVFLKFQGLLSSSPVTSMVDTEGNSYTQRFAARVADSNNNAWCEIWTATVTNGSGSNNTVTVTWTGGSTAQNAAVEYTNTSLTPFDTAVGKAGGATNPTQTTINCAGANETIVGCGGFQGGNQTFTSTTFTFRTGTVTVLLAIGDLAGVSGSNSIDMSCAPERPSLVAISLFPGGSTPQRTLVGVGT